jgi:hypothetical protein
MRLVIRDPLERQGDLAIVAGFGLATRVFEGGVQRRYALAVVIEPLLQKRTGHVVRASKKSCDRRATPRAGDGVCGSDEDLISAFFRFEFEGAIGNFSQSRGKHLRAL